jgi:hypothetical protein
MDAMAQAYGIPCRYHLICFSCSGVFAKVALVGLEILGGVSQTKVTDSTVFVIH